MALDDEVEPFSQQRIRRARETVAALDRMAREHSAESVVAFHDVHARHLREVGDEPGAVRAEERARCVRELYQRPKGRVDPRCHPPTMLQAEPLNNGGGSPGGWRPFGPPQWWWW